MSPRTQDPDLSVAVTALMKGVVYRESTATVWTSVTALAARIEDHVGVLGLTAVIDDAEGYAFLRQRPDDPDAEVKLPRLVARRSLSFPVSLLLALLRKKLAEHDARSGDTRLVLTREQIVELLVLFLPPASNEARLVDNVDAHIAKAVELGFLAKVGDQSPEFEVRRILKAYVDAQWLAEFDTSLAHYAETLTGAQVS